MSGGILGQTPWSDTLSKSVRGHDGQTGRLLGLSCWCVAARLPGKDTWLAGASSRPRASAFDSKMAPTSEQSNFGYAAHPWLQTPMNHLSELVPRADGYGPWDTWKAAHRLPSGFLAGSAIEHRSRREPYSMTRQARRRAATTTAMSAAFKGKTLRKTAEVSKLYVDTVC